MRKKITVLALFATLLGGTFSVPAYATTVTDVDTNYDVAENVLNIKGIFEGNELSWINIVVVPGNVTDISPENLSNIDSVALKSVRTDSTGAIDINIDLSDDIIENQRYTYYIYPNDEELVGYFCKIDSRKLGELTKNVNEAVSEEEIKRIIENAIEELKLDFEQNRDKGYIAKYLYNAKPEDGYTEESLIDNYFLAEGLDTTKKDFDLKSFMTEYMQYVGKTYLEDYESLDETLAKKFSELFSANRSTGNFDEIYNANLFAVKCIYSQSSVELKNIILYYLGNNNIDYSDYNKIGNNVYKEKVFENLFVSRDTFTGKEDILKRFTEECQKQKNEVSKLNNNSSGGGGGTGGSGTTIKPNTGMSDVANNQTLNQQTGINQALTQDENDYAVFSDVVGHWAEEFVKDLYKINIVSGREDGTFGADEEITRAEFAKMIVSVLELQSDSDCKFTDVSKDDWYYRYVTAAAENDLIFGDDGKFRPNEAITREDATVILYRILTSKGVQMDNETVSFADAEDVSSYAVEAIEKLACVEIINGYDDNTFKPKKKITRAESAVIISKLVRLLKTIDA